MLEILAGSMVLAAVGAFGVPLVWRFASWHWVMAHKQHAENQQYVSQSAEASTRSVERREELAEVKHRQDIAEQRARTLRSEAMALAMIEHVKALPPGDIQAAASVKNPDAVDVSGHYIPPGDAAWATQHAQMLRNQMNAMNGMGRP